MDRGTSRPLIALTIVVAALAWLIVSFAVGFPARWEGIFQSLVAALTLAMVFVIQHTQARQQAATQRKLDEILQAPLTPPARAAVRGQPFLLDDPLYDWISSEQERQIKKLLEYFIQVTSFG
jgi:low affinity Fe/Cu permease